MQHLGVLTAAGGVIARRRGRDGVNYVNPVPLREWYESSWTPNMSSPKNPELSACT